MGRPPITLDDNQRGEVETLAALLNQDQIADYLGIARTTFRAICAREPDIAERYKRGKAKAIAHVANGLLQKARSGCTTSSIFYLKTQAGWRETERIEHVGAEDAPLVPTLITLVAGDHRREAADDPREAADDPREEPSGEGRRRSPAARLTGPPDG